jgi:basic membrane protein A
MVDVAPATTLASIRTNWVPYILGAAEAVMNGQIIEEAVPGHVHGNDISAGFEQDWVQILELNRQAVADGTEDKMNQLIENFKKEKVDVFRGKYTGVNPEDPSDTIDLTLGFKETEHSSSPSFRYILNECVIEERTNN